jgi:Protein of unknown function (DUF3037)
VPSRYSVVQYLPDPVTDERINIGVVAFGDGVMRARFVRNWRRVGSFGGPDIDFLKKFARDVETAAEQQIPLALEGSRLDAEALRQAAGRWMNSIQLTEPRGSTLEPDELVGKIARRFLRDRVRVSRRGRDRRVATAAAARSLESALHAHGSRHPEKYIQGHHHVEGAHDEHIFDLALVNGTTQLGVLSISFELGVPAYLSREVRATAWTLDDVRPSGLPITVVTLPPRGKSKTYDHAVALFSDLEARVVEEADVPDWAAEVTDEIYPALIAAG